MGVDIAFWIIAVLCVGGALGVVLLRDIFRAALFLIFTFLTVAGIFIILSADFLAAVQILMYIGAISVLIILAIMLTREVTRGSLFNKLQAPALAAAVLFLGAVGYALLNTDWILSTEPPLEPTTAALADSLFAENGFILPVEISAVLILVAILGAIVMVREK